MDLVAVTYHHNFLSAVPYIILFDAGQRHMAEHPMQCKESTSSHTLLLKIILILKELKSHSSGSYHFRNYMFGFCPLPREHSGVTRGLSTQFFTFKIMGNHTSSF